MKTKRKEPILLVQTVRSKFHIAQSLYYFLFSPSYTQSERTVVRVRSFGNLRRVWASQPLNPYNMSTEG
jgi:hypothetical protein